MAPSPPVDAGPSLLALPGGRWSGSIPSVGSASPRTNSLVPHVAQDGCSHEGDEILVEEDADQKDGRDHPTAEAGTRTIEIPGCANAGMIPLTSPPLPIGPTAGAVLVVSIAFTLLWIRSVFR